MTKRIGRIGIFLWTVWMVLFFVPMSDIWAAGKQTVTLEMGQSAKIAAPTAVNVTSARILSAAKSRADYVRTKNFHYGDAQRNPAFDDSERLVSCDRFVQWVFYDLGFHDLPEENGLWLSASKPQCYMQTWCKNHGFQKITDKNKLSAGDIVFLGQNSPKHVYILGKKKSSGLWERYDCGAESRIHSVQPFEEPVDYPQNPFCYAYRIPLFPGTWTSSDSRIAEVDDAGKVTAKKCGSCTVTLQAEAGTYTYSVKVVMGTPKVDAERDLPANYTGKAIIAGESVYVVNGKKYTGNRTVSGKTYYYKNGVKYTGFRKKNKKTYYYSKGLRKSGFCKINGYYYYFYSNGVMKHTSWGNIGAKRYYFNKNGRAVTGLRKIDGYRYYFYSNGNLKKSSWGNIGAKRYYFDKKGRAVTGLRKIGGYYYYFYSNGNLKKSSWGNIGKGRYYFDYKGRALSGWQNINGKNYYFNTKNCRLQRS